MPTRADDYAAAGKSLCDWDDPAPRDGRVAGGAPAGAGVGAAGGDAGAVEVGRLPPGEDEVEVARCPRGCLAPPRSADGWAWACSPPPAPVGIHLVPKTPPMTPTLLGRVEAAPVAGSNHRIVTSWLLGHPGRPFNLVGR